MKATILSVGTEILLGDIVNTNSQYLSQKLAESGIDVYTHLTVGDNYARLKDAFIEQLERVDIIITSGGLGPTVDDITKEVAFDVFNKTSVLDKKTEEKLKNYFKNINKKMPENNLKQAYFPEDAIILENQRGSAPGCIIENNNKYIIMLPGPPAEMYHMFENAVVPFLKKFQDSVIVSEVIRFYNLGEGEMDKRVRGIINKYTNPTVAPYAKFGESILRITAKAETGEAAKKMIKPVKEEIYQLIGDYAYAEGDMNMAEKTSTLLVDNNLTVAVAESCTGGIISSMFIDYPGISKVFIEGIVTYSNQSKIRNLNVSPGTIEKYGAVSQQCAGEMAKGIAEKSGADIAVSTSGIAGPSGGTEEKPVGLVCFGLYFKGSVRTYELQFRGTRENIRKRAAMAAMNFIREAVLENIISD